MAQIHLERTIDAPVEEVFDWLAEPANLAAAPLALRGAWAKGSSGPRAGAQREVLGVGSWFREEITAYDRPRSYSYHILRSVPPIDHRGGTLTFTPSGEGTHVEWVTDYTHPAWVGGRLLETVTTPLLRSSFVAILDACAKALQKQVQK
jgi:uncharacterized protein YndB with AHSA1/START domain